MSWRWKPCWTRWSPPPSSCRGPRGVQEAGYIGLGALFGIPAELALGAALLRRGRDLAWGVPILLAWQWREVRRLRRA